MPHNRIAASIHDSLRSRRCCPWTLTTDGAENSVPLNKRLRARLPHGLDPPCRAGVSACGLGSIPGLLGCAVALPAMRSVLYGVGVYDPTTMVAVVLTLCAVTVFATTPILKIARIDPVRALREQ